MFLVIDRMEESFPWPDHPPCATANANLAGAFRHLRDCDAALHRPSQRWIVGERIIVLSFYMFAGGYGGNRIKCRIVHHDPVLGFGFDFGIRFCVSTSRNHVAQGASYCRRNATTGSKNRAIH